jgi:hypothetical protein
LSFQRFPSPRSRHGFRRACPSAFSLALHLDIFAFPRKNKAARDVRPIAARAPKSSPNHAPGSDTRLKDSCIGEVRSQRSGVTRSPPVDPLLAFVPFEEFSLRVLAFHCWKTSSCELSSEPGQVQIHRRTLEFQRTQRLACLLRELPPSMGFLSWFQCTKR